MKQPWFKCDPQALNDGFMGLSAAERGAYITILNCIYINGGPVKDGAGYFCSQLGCSTKEWVAWRRKLVRLGKLRVIDGCLTNIRAEREIAEYAAWVEKSRRGGVASAKARGLKPNHLKLVE